MFFADNNVKVIFITLYYREVGHMYKGSRKQVMVIKGTGGIFDEAHFIVNDNNGNRVSEDDMVKEANRIIAEYRSCGIGGTEGKGRADIRRTGEYSDKHESRASDSSHPDHGPIEKTSQGNGFRQCQLRDSGKDLQAGKTHERPYRHGSGPP